MNIRLINAVQMKELRSVIRPSVPKQQLGLRLRSWLREMGFGRQNCCLVAELEGKTLGYLVGALGNANGMLEDLFVGTTEGMAEVSQGLMEIFEVHCLERECDCILAPPWMDEVLIKARGFRFSGTGYVKSLR
ncbi:MAG TPA: hypothetical protein VMZ27_03045 [Candidatus Saccharimonadales bacterium]|nr:hypothetical protein [Candidatus Saccharimonadales bacterium]